MLPISEREKSEQLKQVDDTWRELNEVTLLLSDLIKDIDKAKEVVRVLGDYIVKRDWSCDECIHLHDSLYCDICARHYSDLMERTKSND